MNTPINFLTEQLTQGLSALKLDVSKQNQEKLINYISLLIKWNHAYNLTAITQPEEILREHIFDSLAIAKYLQGERTIDVGTGAGLPGIPLALALPQHHFVLVDSIGKKIRFLTQVQAELNINNIEIIQARAEAFFPEQCFNNVVARAVASIKEIMEKTAHLCCPDGQWLLMKGVFPQAELQEVTGNIQVHPLQVPGLNKQRHLVEIKKENRG